MSDLSCRNSWPRLASWLLVLAAGSLVGDIALAARPASISLESIQRIDVPADAPQSWPFRDEQWLPLNRSHFEKLLETAIPASPGPVEAALQEVRYFAVFSGDSLTQGHFETEWKAGDARKKNFASLGTPNLAIDDLSWADRRAVWGTDLQGRHWVWLDRREGMLQGAWSRRGRQLSAGTAFDLQLLPAAITQLQLEVPRDVSVISDRGDVESAPHPGDDSRKLWTVHLGNLSQCRLVIAPVAKPKAGLPVVLYEQETAVTVGSGDPQLNVTFQAEVLQGEIDRLTISMPRSVEVASFTYGDQTALAWEPFSAEGPSGKVLVTLPEKARGRLRPIRMEGTLRRESADSLTVPQIGLESGTWLDGRINVGVVRPWELRSYRATGCRLASPPTPTSESESTAFQQLTPRSQLLLNIERPTTERIAHALNLLTASDAAWTLTTEIAFGSRSGAVYSASCRIPDDWNVASVVQLGGGRETEQLPGWEVQTTPDSGQLLLLEFSEGLTPGRINGVRIIAKRSRDPGTPPAGWPLILPIDCETTDVVLFGRASALAEIMPQQSDALEAFDQATATAAWNTLPSWSRVSQEPEFHLLHVTNLDALRSPIADGNQRALDSEAHIQVRLAEDGLSEQVVLQLRSATPGSEVELELPAALAEAIWSIKEFPERPMTLRRSISANGDMPKAGEYHRYLVKIPDDAPPTLTFVGLLETSRSSEFRIPLLFVPTARAFRGTVTVRADVPGAYRILETLKAATTSSEPGGWITTEQKRWQYHGTDHSWVILAENGGRPESIQPSAALRTLVSAQSHSHDLHELTVRAPSAADLRASFLQLPDSAELIAILQNGQLLPVSTDGRRLTLSGWNSAAGGDLQVVFRTPATAMFCRTQHWLSIPQTSWRSTSLTWQICLPPEAEVHSLPGEPARSPHSAAPTWRQSLFGVLGRTDGQLRASDATGSVQSNRPSTAVSNQSPNELPTDTLQFPEDWQVLSLNILDAPESARFVVWDRADLRLLSWATLIIAWPIGWWMRRQPSFTRSRLLAALPALAGCLAVFGPEGWRIVIGSGCAGLIVGILLPIEHWRFVPKRQDSVEGRSVSTEVFRKAVTSAAVGAIIGCGLRMLRAQDGRPDAVEAADIQQFRVLVPVDHKGAPSRNLPLVYVTPEFLDALSTAAAAAEDEPAQLISEAHTSISRDASGRLIIRARYAVEVMSAAPPEEVRIPLDPGWRSSLEACYVNEMPFAATADSTGRELIIPLEPLPQADVPANASRMRSWRFDALLQFRWNSTSTSAESEFRAELFPVLNRRLIWQASVPLQHVEIPEARGQTTVSLDRRTLQASLGTSSSVTVFNRAIEPKVEPMGATELEILQLLTLRPAASQVAFRVQCRVLEGTVNRLEAILPAGGVLREIRGNKVLQTLYQTTESDRARIILEFSEPLEGEFVVEGEYIIPRVSSDSRAEFPRLEIACGAASAVRELVATTATGPDFQTQPINLDDPSILPLPVEQFVARWGDSIPTLRPHAAFQVQPKGQPAFRLLFSPAEQQLVSWNEDVAVSRQRLDWVLSAEISSGRMPALTYSLLLDRRLNLESVSVQSNGAEQLLRWSKTPLIGSSQNRLTLFLNREVSGTAQLRIRGTLRVRPGTPIAVPSVRFELSQSAPGTLSVTHEAGHRLTILGRDIPPEATAPAPEGGGEAAAGTGRRLKISEGETGLSLRLDPLAGPCVQQSSWFIAPGETTLRLHGQIVLTPLERTREVRLPLPEWLNDERFTAVQPGPPPTEHVEGNQRFLQWSCDPERNESLQLSWETELPLPAGDTLKLPLPTALKAAEHTSWVAIEPNSAWTVANPSSTSRIEPAGAAQSSLPGNFFQGAADVIPLDGDALMLERRDAQSADGPTSVRMIEHTMRNSSNGGWLGQTDVHPSPSGIEIAIKIPADLDVQLLLVDDLPVPLDQFDANARQWRVRDVGRHRRLTVRWRQSDSTRMTRASEVSARLPTCVQEKQPETFVRLLSSASRWVVISRNGTSVSPWELAAVRVETEQRRQSQFRDDRPMDDAGARQLWRDYRRAAELFAQSTAADDVTPQQRQRWESITATMRLVSTDPETDAAAASFRDSSLIDIEANDRIYRLPANQPDQFTAWIVREDLVRWSAGGLTFLIAAAILWRIIGWLSLPWWRAHPAAAWLVCGVVWSVCFTPSILGWAMTAWAAWVWWRKPFGKPIPAVP